MYIRISTLSHKIGTTTMHTDWLVWYYYNKLLSKFKHFCEKDINYCITNSRQCNRVLSHTVNSMQWILWNSWASMMLPIQTNSYACKYYNIEVQNILLYQVTQWNSLVSKTSNTYWSDDNKDESTWILWRHKRLNWKHSCSAASIVYFCQENRANYKHVVRASLM